MYSSDFIDAINSDSKLNTIALAISEVLIFTKTLTWLSMQAKNFCMIDTKTLTSAEIKDYIKTATKMRGDLAQTTQKLEKYTNNLNDEILKLFSQTGVKYEEFDR